MVGLARNSTRWSRGSRRPNSTSRWHNRVFFGRSCGRDSDPAIDDGAPEVWARDGTIAVTISIKERWIRCSPTVVVIGRRRRTSNKPSVNKLDLICRKLGLARGMRLLDIGCGFGSSMRHAAEHYGVHCVGLTISAQQLALGTQLAGSLPVRFELIDYRDFNRDRTQSSIASPPARHVRACRPKNYRRDYFEVGESITRARRIVLIAHDRSRQSRRRGLPWIEKYIFPNAVLPSMSDITRARKAFRDRGLAQLRADYDRHADGLGMRLPAQRAC
jgi:cyclopropane fatty-acyl-phospholipid synthase-like methyltransferase